MQESGNQSRGTGEKVENSTRNSRVKVVDGEAHVLDVSALLAAVQDGLQIEVEVCHVGVLL